MAILDFVEETEKAKKKINRQIPQGQYAYAFCKYLEMIWAVVFKWEQKQNAGIIIYTNQNVFVHTRWNTPHWWHLKFESDLEDIYIESGVLQKSYG